MSTPTGLKMWLNPPRHDDPHTDVVVRLSQDTAAWVVETLRQGAHAAVERSDRSTAADLHAAASRIEGARQTPAEADAAGLSREASWHPANVLSGVTTAALRNAARWSSPTALVGQAIETAAAIAYSRDGDAGKQHVLDHTSAKLHDVAETGYPDKSRSE